MVSWLLWNAAALGSTDLPTECTHCCVMWRKQGKDPQNLHRVHPLLHLVECSREQCPHNPPVRKDAPNYCISLEENRVGSP